nr:serine/arginine repetitive matrix protein 1-like [Coffea arabica]
MNCNLGVPTRCWCLLSRRRLQAPLRAADRAPRPPPPASARRRRRQLLVQATRRRLHQTMPLPAGHSSTRADTIFSSDPQPQPKRRRHCCPAPRAPTLQLRAPPPPPTRRSSTSSSRPTTSSPPASARVHEPGALRAPADATSLLSCASLACPREAAPPLPYAPPLLGITTCLN